jgi:hypothetical protein
MCHTIERSSFGHHREQASSTRAYRDDDESFELSSFELRALEQHRGAAPIQTRQLMSAQHRIEDRPRAWGRGFLWALPALLQAQLPRPPARELKAFTSTRKGSNG